MNQTVRHLIELNNRAVNYVETNRLNDAISLLSTAIQELRSLNKHFAKEETPDFDCSVSPILLEDDILIEDEDDSRGFVYKQPIQIQAGWEPETTVLSFIIIFNLALAFQLSASTCTDVSSRTILLLEKSKSFYEITYQLLRNKATAFSVRVYLILSNNLGQVLRALNEHQKANRCFQQLLSTVIYLKDCGAEEELNEIDGFLRSTSHLVLQMSTAAAA